MSDRSLANIYAHPADLMEPIAVFLKSVEFLRLDPEASDLVADLLSYTQLLAQTHVDNRQEPIKDGETDKAQESEIDLSSVSYEPALVPVNGELRLVKRYQTADGKDLVMLMGVS
ncbi:hypothetical protein, partial [Xenorhabdus bovienii]|uniref:hypothetical protein n=1 Tax=Xenorhabdus bovienii TaxID=40576 RepID=UPI003DA6A632